MDGPQLSKLHVIFHGRRILAPEVVDVGQSEEGARKSRLQDQRAVVTLHRPVVFGFQVQKKSLEILDLANQTAFSGRFCPSPGGRIRCYVGPGAPEDIILDDFGGIRYKSRSVPRANSRSLS